MLEGGSSLFVPNVVVRSRGSLWPSALNTLFLKGSVYRESSFYTGSVFSWSHTGRRLDVCSPGALRRSGETVILGMDRNAAIQGRPLRDAILELGYSVIDVLQLDPGLDNYVKIAATVCRLLVRADAVGVLGCGTGTGVAIVANKHKGVYAARCVSLTDAEDSRLVNNANVLCLSAQVRVQENIAIARRFFNTRFEEKERILQRLDLIHRLENQSFRDD